MPYIPKEYVNTGEDPLNLSYTDKSNDLYSSILSQLKENNIEELAPLVMNLIQQYGPDMKETIKYEIKNSEAYKNRFSGNEELAKAGYAKLSEAEYLYNERAYSETLSAYGAGDLATRSNFAKFIGKNISPVEVANRFNLAVTKVKDADPLLKQELKKMYPGIEDSDLVRSLLFGKEGSDYLKSRIGQAEILAEASGYNLNLQSDVKDLEQAGVTRQVARERLGGIKESTSALSGIASITGENVDSATIQKELESEALLGRQSARTKRLASQVRAQFEGTQGSVGGSLKRKTSGII